MGSSTTSLSLDISIYTRLHCPRGENPLIKAFRKGVFVQNLRFLTARLRGPSASSQALDAFFKWLLKQTLGLEAMSLCRDSEFSSLGTRLGKLKHLELRSFKVVHLSSLSLAQMPVLETLCIDGSDKHTAVAAIDAVVCSHLRQLALKRTIVQRLTRQPSCQLSCVTNFMTAHYQTEVWTSHMKTVLNSAEHIELSDGDGEISQSAHGTPAALPDMKALAMSGRVIDDETLLPKCMPVDGVPMQNLRVLAMHADTIKCCIPAGLPNLRELIVMAEQGLLLRFEDLEGTFMTLKMFYAFGTPRESTEYDLLFRTLPSLVKRRLCIEAVEGDMLSKPICSSSKCLYLRSLKDEKLSMSALYDIVSRLAKQCKCGACFTCLRAANCIE